MSIHKPPEQEGSGVDSGIWAGRGSYYKLVTVVVVVVMLAVLVVVMDVFVFVAVPRISSPASYTSGPTAIAPPADYTFALVPHLFEVSSPPFPPQSHPVLLLLPLLLPVLVLATPRLCPYSIYSRVLSRYMFVLALAGANLPSTHGGRRQLRPVTSGRQDVMHDI